MADGRATAELVDDAVATHKETTASARRALATIEATKQIQAETLSALHDQGQTIRKVQGDVDNLEEEIKFGKSLLKFLGLCCCCAMCAPDPERQHNRDRLRTAAQQEPDGVGTTGRAAAPAGPGSAGKAAAGGAPSTSSSRFARPDMIKVKLHAEHDS